MNRVGIDVEANVSKARKDLISLENDIKGIQKTAAKGAKFNVKGLNTNQPNKEGFNIGGMQISKVSDLSNLTDIKGILSSGLGKLGGMSLGGLGGVAAGAAAGAGVAAAVAGAWYNEVNEMVQRGKEAQNTYERLNATLGQIGKNIGGITDVSSTVKFLQETAAKGKTPLEALEQSANRLMVAFQGNQTEVKKWIEIVADMSAGSGESATMLTEIITKAKQFDTVEFSVFTQLNEKGIPIIKALADHLGMTTEKAEELARAGKVTGDNFMAAYEIAHRLTYAGANAQGGTDTVAGAQNAIDKYRELQAMAATQGYNAELLPYLKERARYEEEKYNNPYERLNSSASGSLLGGLDKGWQQFKDGLSDFGDYLTKLAGSGQIDDLSISESLRASLGTYGFQAFGTNGIIYDTNGDMVKSSEIDSYINSMRDQLQQEQRKIDNDNFSDEARSHARQAAQDLTNAISICEDALRAVKAHEAELAEIEKKKQIEEEGRKVRDSYNLSRATTADDYSVAMGYETIEALREDFNNLRDKITNGSGNKADLDRLNELQKVIDLADKQEQSRREYDLSAAAASGDQASKVQLQMEQEATKLKALGFNSDEIETRLNSLKDRLINEAQDKQRITEQNLTDKRNSISYGSSSDSINGAWSYHKWERNAWGAAGASYTSFQNPVDQQQLDQLELANNNLKSLINATKAIDTRSLAQ